MIRINKSRNVPNILIKKGTKLADELKKNYQKNPNLYTSADGIKNKDLISMSFDNSIYGHATVKELLINDQHRKCCFCESLFLENSYGDVEHFRPKTAYKKMGQKKLVYPGYYWLAYEWSNLMFSCEQCNRTYKKNEFPLSTETTRKRFHNHPNPLENEDPLLINPNLEDPSQFITFNNEVPLPFNGSPKGAKTIEVFQLERMNNSRLNHLLLLEGILAFTKIDARDEEQIQLAVKTFQMSKDKILELITNANSFFNIAAKDTAEYAYCVRCKFPDLPRI